MELQLQQLTGEILVEQTLNKFDNAGDHMSTRCFRQTGQLTIYNVRVSHLNAKQYQNVETRKTHEINVKRKCHKKRVPNI